MIKRVLITPLDWGLGHATRCIPIIRELQSHGCDVIIAGTGPSLQVLRKEFPLLEYRTIPGYQPRYPSSGAMAWAMATQLPRFLRVVAAEHRAVEVLVREERIGLLISDNRYGCWSSDIPSVFITHQSNVLMPRRFRWFQNIVRYLNERLMTRFNVCWIPDYEGQWSLAGDMASFRTASPKINTRYVGWLSRFQPTGAVEKRYDVVAVLSGPEPQRTMFENIILTQLRRSALSYLVIRGLPDCKAVPEDDSVVNFLTAHELQERIQSADLVIARSGYSTVMDMSALGKKAVFIPTPGQTEQEYLAERLKEKKVAFYMKQDTFDLDHAIRRSRDFSGFGIHVHLKDDQLRDAVRDILEQD